MFLYFCIHIQKRNYMRLGLLTAFILLLSFTTSCQYKEAQPHPVFKDSIVLVTPVEPQPIASKSQTAFYLDSIGLMNIAELDSTFIIRLMYATPDNFTGQLLYTDLKEAYLHPDAAKALLEAHLLLKAQYPSYRLIIYDAARPMSVQKKMWDVVKGTSKYMYVSNPSRGGGLHNYGLAVDISIADSLGHPLPMGTEVDYMDAASHITNEAKLVREGKITQQERENRILLRQVMKSAGFRALPSEWWHFNLCSRDEAKQKYKLIN